MKKLIRLEIKLMLSSIILAKIRGDHRGKENAIKRRDLLLYAQQKDIHLTDRELRKIYCELPVCSSERGIFWPVTSEEIDEYYIYLRAKAIPLFERWRRVAKQHSKLLSHKYSEQMELF